jgi:hypothetical protein
MRVGVDDRTDIPLSVDPGVHRYLAGGCHLAGDLSPVEIDHRHVRDAEPVVRHTRRGDGDLVVDPDTEVPTATRSEFCQPWRVRDDRLAGRLNRRRAVRGAHVTTSRTAANEST